MQELRFVLIIVGALAIAALLFHGLWTSRKESKSKFGDKPLGRIEEKEASSIKNTRAFPQEREHKKSRKEPDFSLDDNTTDPFMDDDTHHDRVDPLFAGYVPEEDDRSYDLEHLTIADIEAENEAGIHVDSNMDQPVAQDDDIQQAEPVQQTDSGSDEPDYQVIVLNVHCAGSESFVGTKLFDSLQQNGLLYGEMDIYHRHADLSGTGKVLFSVANIMQPGTLKHDDPNAFTTKGISFFMTLPCYGDPEQNFKLMLKTAQQIADDLGGNVLDDQRLLMTPDKLADYRRQIQAFKAQAV
ncbi:cell division protein ZipA [Vibrio gazogenes]|uniref:Cell division protein ZipA n=1 Tax=Vibrio gazogenes DSM 21264 = NBRC 103151 TaxID=1123492 RepID=A0A1M5DJE9_VIBGA|nr:cell division protein ZipA [Vibrio gazogenes]USP14598.1 cell division protein ZipA [Vibrio gazogenes]SHF67080.1 cell division protein ZipA [Vibrio gazogenes DSM 21264] [Vibrio gazogenes DSM 21264 = NBRC 103151]